MTSASHRVSCSRRRDPCGPRRCRGWPPSRLRRAWATIQAHCWRPTDRLTFGHRGPALSPLITQFSSIAANYDVVLSDVWGVVHNGLVAFPHACDALMRMRAQGGIVVLITNAPRPSGVVSRQLERLHVPGETYDAIVS